MNISKSALVVFSMGLLVLLILMKLDYQVQLKKARIEFKEQGRTEIYSKCFNNRLGFWKSVSDEGSDFVLLSREDIIKEHLDSSQYKELRKKESHATMVDTLGRLHSSGAITIHPKRTRDN